MSKVICQKSRFRHQAIQKTIRKEKLLLKRKFQRARVGKTPKLIILRPDSQEMHQKETKAKRQSPPKKLNQRPKNGKNILK
jgi:hypothetical protein|tara:strand:+ start:234 stop:476 length:243 start_codon:yes stop_codon:yes gene_type:complete